VANAGPWLGEFEEIVLLAVARLAGDGYGVSIRREIEERSGRSVSIGAVYATLERLAVKGWVTSRQGEALPVRGGRARRHYRVLPAGVRALEETRRAFDRLWEGVALRGATKA
jgi:DNA-binding PadR family transcriptional regulator